MCAQAQASSAWECNVSARIRGATHRMANASRPFTFPLSCDIGQQGNGGAGRRVDEVLAVKPRILIIHTPAQLEEASSLVDVLEAALPLPEGAVQCSSLPGYTFTTRSGQGITAAEFSTLLDGLGAALALVDEPALCDGQFWFDVAAVWGRGKRLTLVIDSPERTSQLPSQLADTVAIVRADRSGLTVLVEDLAFDLGLEPRISSDAVRAIELLSSFPPSAVPNQNPTVRPRQRAAAPAGEADDVAPAVPGPLEQPASAADHHEAARDEEPSRLPPAVDFRSHDTVPPPPRLPGEALAASAEDDDGDAGFEEVDDDDIEPVPQTAGPRSGVERRLTCEMAFEAGRALAECSYHRDDGGDFSSELDGPFGRFVDAVGGSWQQLKRLGDVELWLGATDNLLESLPPSRRDACEWYEIGFQFSTLRSIAEEGLPEQSEQRATFQELWNRAMTQLRTSAVSAGIAPRDIRRLQAQLENLIGPSEKRDYRNLARTLEALRSFCAAADGTEPQLAGRAAG